MKKSILLLLFSCQILIIYAKSKELILKNEVSIINKSLIEILEKEVFPHVLFNDDCVQIYLKHDKIRDVAILYINIRSLSYISKEQWKNYDGFCDREDILIVFKNCKRNNIILRKVNTTPLKVYPSDDIIIEDRPSWIYEFKNGKLKSIEEVLVY